MIVSGPTCAVLMTRSRATADQSRYGTRGVTASILALIALFAPVAAHGQCQPIADSAKLAASKTPAVATQPEFFDEPQFTVAGVTDTTSLGGHGSNVVVRTKETLAKDVVALGSAPGTRESGTKDTPHGPAQTKQGNPL